MEEGDRQKILDYLYQNDGIIQRDRENNPSRSEFFDGVKQFYNYEQYFRDLMQQPDSNFVRTGMVGQDLQAMVDEGFYADPTPQLPSERDEGFYADPTFPPFSDDPTLPPFSDDFRDEIPYYNPNQLNPFFNPDDIEVADGGYISRKMNRGGIMSLRGY